MSELGMDPDNSTSSLLAQGFSPAAVARMYGTCTAVSEFGERCTVAEGHLLGPWRGIYHVSETGDIWEA